ncbi:MAG: 50S ribosomal protein L13 [Minisyncoccales bacterium]
MKKEENKICTIDARGKPLGRLASEVVRILRGKNLPSFKPNIVPSQTVKIINLSATKINSKKMEEKFYKKHSGYPGGLKYIAFKKMWEKNPGETFKKMVRGMLPNNKLRKKFLKNLIIE